MIVKHVLAGVIIGLFGASVASARIAAPVVDEPAEKKIAVVRVVAGEEPAEGHVAVVRVASGEEQGHQRVVVGVASEEGAGSEPGIFVMKKMTGSEDGSGVVAQNIEAGGPWLGVQFGPVTKPLAAHLRLAENTGQMILNVAEGSPADLAGLQQYDVLVGVDGKSVSSDLGAFLELVRSFSPNELRVFDVIRESTSQRINLTVGARPENWASLKYKYESDQPEVIGGQVFRRGGIIEKDPAGVWQFKELDELKDMQDVWQHMPKFDPQDVRFQWRGLGAGGPNKMQIFIDKGHEVRIETDAAGKMTVTKTIRENDQESTTTQTYENEAAFEAADPEAFKSFKSDMGVGPGNFFFERHAQRLPGGVFYRGVPECFEIDVDTQRELAEAMRDSAQNAQQRAEEARQRALELKERLEVTIRENLSAAPGEDGRRRIMIRQKVGTSFEVEADGSIRVVTRSGDAEIVERFQNIEQMKTSRPELFEKYEAVRNIKE